MKMVPRPGKGERPDRPKTWTLYWELPRTPGRRPQKTETFHGSKEEAETRWYAVRAEIDRQGLAYVEPSKERLGDFLRGWLDRRITDAKIEVTTGAAYRELIETHIIPYVGHLPLTGVTPLAIEGMLTGMVAGQKRSAVSGRRAQQARMVLGKALSDAVRLGLLQQNPVVRTERPAHSPKKAKAFTPEQVERLFQAAAKSRMLPLFQLAYHTGMRRGELLGLTWKDVNLKGRTATIHQTLVAVSSMGTVIKKPKSEAGERVVTLTSQAVAALEAQRRQVPGEWVFTKADGTPYKPIHVYHDFCRFRDRAGIPKYPFHSLRHTNVSVRIAAGVPLEVVSKQVGHSDIRVTSQIYSHLLPETDRGAADLLEDYLRSRHRE